MLLSMRVCIHASGAVVPLPIPPMSMRLPTLPLWGGVGSELITYTFRKWFELNCRRTHLPTIPPEQGSLSRKLLQKTTSLEKLWSQAFLAKSLILAGAASSLQQATSGNVQPGAQNIYIYIYTYILYAMQLARDAFLLAL